MGTHADFPLRRAPGWKGSFKYLFDIFSLLPRLKGYDIVQLINPHFLELRPGKLAYLFNTLRRNNGRVFLTLAGDDSNYIRQCVRKDKQIFRFSEMRIADRPTAFASEFKDFEYGWLRDDVSRYSEMVYEEVAGAMAVLPEYDMAAREILDPKKLAFTNLPIDLDLLPFRTPDITRPLQIFVGQRKERNRAIQKGTLLLADFARSLEKEFPGRCEAVVVENLPLNEYLRRMADTHIVLDQLYAYSPATNALQAMALGKAVATGAQPEYFDYIGSSDRDCLIAARPDDDAWKDEIRALIREPQLIVDKAVKARKIVEENNALPIVADRFIKAWEEM